MRVATYNPPAVGIAELNSARAKTSNMMKKTAMSQPHVMGSRPRNPKLYQIVPWKSNGQTLAHHCRGQTRWLNRGRARARAQRLTSKTRQETQASQAKRRHGPEVEASLHLLLVAHLLQPHVFSSRRLEHAAVLDRHRRRRRPLNVGVHLLGHLSRKVFPRRRWFVSGSGGRGGGGWMNSYTKRTPLQDSL